MSILRYVVGRDLVKEEVPEHLSDLRGEIQRIIIADHGDDDYAEIAFKLLAVSQGDKDAIKDVAEYIKHQHQELKDAHVKLEAFLNAVSQWLYWAKNWTVRK